MKNVRCFVFFRLFAAPMAFYTFEWLGSYLISLFLFVCGFQRIEIWSAMNFLTFDLYRSRASPISKKSNGGREKIKSTWYSWHLNIRRFLLSHLCKQSERKTEWLHWDYKGWASKKWTFRLDKKPMQLYFSQHFCLLTSSRLPNGRNLPRESSWMGYWNKRSVWIPSVFYDPQHH